MNGTACEPCFVSNICLSLPVDFLRHPQNSLRDICTLRVWKELFTEEERYFLRCLLPFEGSEDPKELSADQEKWLEHVFQCGNVFFGNPLDSLMSLLREGEAHPSIQYYRERCVALERSMHRYRVKQYHNVMMRSLASVLSGRPLLNASMKDGGGGGGRTSDSETEDETMETMEEMLMKYDM